MGGAADAPARRVEGAARWAWVLGAAAAVLVADQVTKQLAVDRLRGRPPVELFWTLQLNYAENTGMAFSRGAGAGPLIGLVAVVIVAVVLFMARRFGSVSSLVLAGVVVGGALGNVVDRLTRVPEGGKFMSGAVVDFVDLQWWPVFNVADAAIVVGGIALALVAGREPGADVEPGPDAADDAATGPDGVDGPAADHA